MTQSSVMVIPVIAYMNYRTNQLIETLELPCMLLPLTIYVEDRGLIIPRINLVLNFMTVILYEWHYMPM